MKKLILSIINQMGYDLVKYPNFHLKEQQDYLRLLSSYGIDLVFDIGANVGQYGESILKNGYKGRLISFEPMPKEHEILSRKSLNHPNWEIFEPTAIGRENNDITFNISRNSVSSSALELSEYVKESSPDTEYTGSIVVHQKRIDDIFEELKGSSSNIFLKIDVQGMEMEVFEGANKSMQSISGIHVEFSLKPLYEKQSTMTSLFNYIIEQGFHPVYFIPHPTMDKIGRMLQVDALFFRSKF